MVELYHYPCWDPTTAATTISTEAVSPSRSVFFATHAPLRIQRSSASGVRPNRPGEPVDEEAVRHDFLTRKMSNGVLLMPILGESGTGKSHLVRWVKEKTPSTDRRQIIYLPKTGTSLRAVVEALLADIHSNDLAHLRADVQRMGTEIDQAGLERRLLNQLQEAIAAAEPPPGTARVLAGPRGLAVLLLDPHVRDYLLQPHRLIPKLAANLLANRAEGDPDRPLIFAPDDIPLDIVDVKKASDMAQKRLTLLKSRPELQVAALEMLNSHLDVAVMNATNLGVGRLRHAMLEIRREYARQGREIVLLIEDFALIQGVQRDLLDALIEVGIREGRDVLAPIRTLMAVTTGYYHRLADTVLTRAKAATPYVYDLDVQFDESDADAATAITSFVGRYLNAARIGREELDAADIRSADDTRNFCERCTVRDDCHPAFGTSDEGYGLYPFNRPALLRAIHARAPQDKPRAFNARSVLGEVVRNVLVEHAEDLQAGRFPAANFRREYPTADIDTALPSAVRNALDDMDVVDAERRATVLEFWGDAPPHPINLAPALHRAFDLVMLDLDAAGDPRPVAITPTAQPALQPAVFHDLPPSTSKAIHEVEEWFARGRVLPQQTASDIRTIVGDAVLRRCQWNDPLMSEPGTDVLRRAWPAKSVVVSIEGAAAEGLPGTAEAPIRFLRTSANAVFFQGLLRAKAGKVAGNAEHVRRLQEIADLHRRHLVQAVQRVQGFTDWEIATAMRGSLLGAALSGRASPDMSEPQLLAAILDDGRAWSRGDIVTRTPRWVQMLEAHLASRAELVTRIRAGIGVSRGTTGGVRMIDAARVVPLLGQAIDGWTWTTPSSPPPDWVRKSVSGFGEWDALVDAQVASLAEQHQQVRRLLPKGTRGVDTVLAVTDAADAAIPLGHAPQDRDEFGQMVKEAAALNWKCIDQLENDLERIARSKPADATHRYAKIAAAVRDRGDDLASATTFLQRSNAWLDSALQATALRQNRVGDDAARQVRELLGRWSEVGGGRAI